MLTAGPLLHCESPPSASHPIHPRVLHTRGISGLSYSVSRTGNRLGTSGKKESKSSGGAMYRHNSINTLPVYRHHRPGDHRSPTDAESKTVYPHPLSSPHGKASPHAN
eukprot:9467615-Pyramimonas_sp.AAC.1